MRTAWLLLLGLAVVLALTGGVRADNSQEKVETLKGTITCAKCDLKEAAKCHTVIKVDKDGKDVVYYFDDASGKKYHGKICTSPTKGTVQGTVTEKDGKMWVKVTKVEFGE
jgi:hypothetical protein